MRDWQTSTYCIQNSCVETAHGGGTVHVRDARQGPIVTVPMEVWREFVDGLKARGGTDGGE